MQGTAMKLAIVHDWLTGMRGGEKCLEVLCRAFPDAELFTLLHVRGSTSPAIERMRIHTSFLQRLPGAARRYRYLLPLMPAAIERLTIPHGVDAVVSLSHAVAKGVRPPRGVPHICYCFTPVRYAWHLRGEYFERPETAGGAISVARKILANPLAAARDAILDRIRAWDLATSDRVTRFVAISRTVAVRIAECYGRQSTVIYPPVDTEFYTPAATAREDFYLCVSALSPYKRIDRAIDACRRLGRRLIVIGEGPERRRLEGAAGPHVQFLGWQTNETIRDHLRRCRALLFPGVEDFGIVPLEAAACGAPVIALGQGGATETVLAAHSSCRGTGVLFPNPSAESLSEAMTWLEAHPQQFDAGLSRHRAEQFATARFASELLGYIRDVVGDAATISWPPVAA
jgi:glycosyltransferase involved in cell wall biosynthesis